MQDEVDMTFEIVTDDFGEGTSHQMPTENIDRTTHSAMDVEINTGNLLKINYIYQII